MQHSGKDISHRVITWSDDQTQSATWRINVRAYSVWGGSTLPLLLQLSSLLSPGEDSYHLTVECCINVALACAHSLCCPFHWTVEASPVVYTIKQRLVMTSESSIRHTITTCDIFFTAHIAPAQDWCMTAVMLCPYGHPYCSGKPWTARIRLHWRLFMKWLLYRTTQSESKQVKKLREFMFSKLIFFLDFLSKFVKYTPKKGFMLLNRI